MLKIEPNPRIKAIVAMAKNRVIGNKQKLPWNLPEDLKHFSKITKNHIVLMGRVTYEGLPENYKPLPKRLNIVLSQSKGEKSLSIAESEIKEKHVTYVKDFETAYSLFNLVAKPNQNLWIIGGGSLYQESLLLCSELILTLLNDEKSGDTFFPEFENNFIEKSRTEYKDFSIINYLNVNICGPKNCSTSESNY
jgi:dihydrofolate reductase